MANIRTSDEVAAELRKLTGRLVAETGVNASLSEVIAAAVTVANDHFSVFVDAHRAATAKSS